jgi:hypothetical protein
MMYESCVVRKKPDLKGKHGLKVKFDLKGKQFLKVSFTLNKVP